MLALRRAAASLAPRLLAQEAAPSLSAAFNCIGGGLQREQQQQPSTSVAYRGEAGVSGSYRGSWFLDARSRGLAGCAEPACSRVGSNPACLGPRCPCTRAFASSMRYSMLYGRAAGPWKAVAPASDRRRPGLEHLLLPPPSLCRSHAAQPMPPLASWRQRRQRV